MKWNATLGICNCTDNKVPYGKGAAIKCAACKGGNIIGTLNEIDVNKCACPSTDFNFTISAAGVPSCICGLKNSIVTLAQECKECTAVIAEGGTGILATAHECKCAPTFYWAWKTNECLKCSADANAKTTGGNNVACVCVTGYVWDVITQSCVEACAANDYTCLACADIPNTDGTDAVLASSLPASSRIAVAGADTIKALLSNTAIPTNYPKLLSRFQCGCNENFLWDPVHLQCVSSTLN